MIDRNTCRGDFVRLLAGLCLFGVAFGFVEAAVVVNLRAIYEPLQREFHPETSEGDLFPLLSLTELEQASPSASRLLQNEVVREACTILMLVGVGLCAGGSGLKGFAGFLVAFGIWDIFYYVFLFVLKGWPASVWTWDLLFLIPFPWVAPVAAPLIVSAVMIVCGIHTLAREGRNVSFRPGLFAWLGVIGGGGLVVTSFCRDFLHVLQGGLPQRFDWPLFGVGISVALVSYTKTAINNRRG